MNRSQLCKWVEESSGKGRAKWEGPIGSGNKYSEFREVVLDLETKDDSRAGMYSKWKKLNRRAPRTAHQEGFACPRHNSVTSLSGTSVMSSLWKLQRWYIEGYTVAITHMLPFKFNTWKVYKMKNSVSQSREPHCKCLVATHGYCLHHSKFYWTVKPVQGDIMVDLLSLSDFSLNLRIMLFYLNGNICDA